MKDKNLRNDQAVNFRLQSRELIHFLHDWHGLECSRHFTTTTLPPEKGEGFVVQIVPRGLTASEDATYFRLLDLSLKNGPMREWKENAEFLPRLEVRLETPVVEPA